MEIKYDMSKNYWNCHNEAQAIVMMRRKLIKNPKRKILSLLVSSIFYVVATLLLLLATFILSKIGIDELFIRIVFDLSIFLGIFLILYFLVIFITYIINDKKYSHEGILLINEEGLKDTSNNGITTFIPWDKISFVALKKYTVTFVTTTKLVVFVPIENKKTILEAIKKYQKSLLIIDQAEEE